MQALRLGLRLRLEGGSRLSYDHTSSQALHLALGLALGLGLGSGLGFGDRASSLGFIESWELGLGLGLGLDLHFAVWVSVLQSTLMQLLS